MNVPKDPICTCVDSAWLVQCFISDRLIDEALVETALPSVEQVMTDVRDKHDMLTNLAIASGQNWCVKIFCPHCRKGMSIDSVKGPEVLTSE